MTCAYRCTMPPDSCAPLQKEYSAAPARVVDSELAQAQQRIAALEAENAALRERDRKQRAQLKLAERMLQWRAEAHARHEGAEQMTLGLDAPVQAALELVAEAEERADAAEQDRDRQVAAAQHRQKVAERRTQVLQSGLELVIDTERESRSKVRHASDRPLLRQLAVIAEVARCADLDGHCWHTQEDLGAVLDVSADTVRRDLAALEQRIHVGPAYSKSSPLRYTRPELWHAGRRKQAWRRQILTLLPHGKPELLQDLGLPARGADALSRMARKAAAARDSARHRDAESLYIDRGSEVSTKRRARTGHPRDTRTGGDRARSEFQDAMQEFSERMDQNPDARRLLEHIRDKAVRAWARIEDKRWRHGRPVHQELRELFLIEAQLRQRSADDLVEQLEAYATSVRWGIAPFALPLAVVLRPGGALEHRWRRVTKDARAGERGTGGERSVSRRPSPSPAPVPRSDGAGPPVDPYQRTIDALRAQARDAGFTPYREALVSVALELEAMRRAGDVDPAVLELVDAAVVEAAVERMGAGEVAAMRDCVDAEFRASQRRARWRPRPDAKKKWIVARTLEWLRGERPGSTGQPIGRAR